MGVFSLNLVVGSSVEIRLEIAPGIQEEVDVIGACLVVQDGDHFLVLGRDPDCQTWLEGGDFLGKVGRVFGIAALFDLEIDLVGRYPVDAE